jgi:hypothetical protein
VLLGNGTSAVSATAVGTTGQVLVGNTGAAPTWATLSSAAVTSFSAGTTGLTPSTATTGAITLGGTLAVANGGTGVTTSTGTGSVVLNTSPTLVTPSLGVASADSIATLKGTVGAVAYGFISNTNTGMWSPSSDAIAFSTAGSERLRVTSAGNVGIGTNSPTFLLQVNGTGYFNSNVQFFPQDGFRFTSVSAVSAMRFGSAFTGESTAEWAYNRAGAVATLSIGATGSALTEIMRAQSNGNVGIGISSPSEKFEVANSTAAFTVMRATNSAGYGKFGVRDSGDAYVEAPSGKAISFWNTTERMRVASDGNVGIGVSAPGTRLQVADVAAPSGFSSTAVRVTRSNYGADFIGYIDQGVGHGGIISTVDNGTPTERMRITNAGNVGIGTTTTGVNDRLRVEGAEARIRSRNSTSGAEMYMGAMNPNEARLWASTSTALTFGTSDAERMRITDGGRVGIGTSAPSARLDVNTGAGTDCIVASRGGNAAYFVLQGTSFFTFNAVQSYDGSGNLQWAVGSQGAANTLSFMVNGNTERARIDSSGNFSLGTTVGLARLRVAAGGTVTVPKLGDVTNYPAFISNPDPSYGLGIGVNPGDGRVWLQAQRADTSVAYNITLNEAGGNVGIGTNNPAARLHVRQDLDGTTGAIIQNRNASGTPIAALRFISGTLDLADNRFAAIASGGVVAADLRFITSSGGPVERMRIDSSGRVGIGTSAPIQLLQVTTSGQSIDGPFFSSSTGPWMRFIPNSSPGAYNGIVAAGTNSFIFSNGSPNAGTLTIAPWADAAGGIVIDASGNVGIGTNSPSSFAKLAVVSSAFNGFYVDAQGAASNAVFNKNNTAGGYCVFNFSGSGVGSITTNGTNTFYNTSSDARLKENITGADDAANLIDALQVRKFDWKSNGTHERYGFVAQELVEVAPEAVHQPEDEDQMMGVDYSKLVPMLVKEIQSLRARVAQLEGN